MPTPIKITFVFSIFLSQFCPEISIFINFKIIEGTSTGNLVRSSVRPYVCMPMLCVCVCLIVCISVCVAQHCARGSEARGCPTREILSAAPQGKNFFFLDFLPCFSRRKTDLGNGAAQPTCAVCENVDTRWCTKKSTCLETPIISLVFYLRLKGDGKDARKQVLR